MWAEPRPLVCLGLHPGGLRRCPAWRETTSPRLEPHASSSRVCSGFPWCLCHCGQGRGALRGPYLCCEGQGQRLEPCGRRTPRPRPWGSSLGIPGGPPQFGCGCALCSAGEAAHPVRAMARRAAPCRARGKRPRGWSRSSAGEDLPGKGDGGSGHRLPHGQPRWCRRCGGRGSFKAPAPPSPAGSPSRCREAPAGAAAGTGRIVGPGVAPPAGAGGTEGSSADGGGRGSLGWWGIGGSQGSLCGRGVEPRGPGAEAGPSPGGRAESAVPPAPAPLSPTERSRGSVPPAPLPRGTPGRGCGDGKVPPAGSADPGGERGAAAASEQALRLRRGWSGRGRPGPAAAAFEPDPAPAAGPGACPLPAAPRGRAAPSPGAFVGGAARGGSFLPGLPAGAGRQPGPTESAEVTGTAGLAGGPSPARGRAVETAGGPVSWVPRSGPAPGTGHLAGRDPGSAARMSLAGSR